MVSGSTISGSGEGLLEEIGAEETMG